MTLALLVGLASPDYSQALFVACRTKFAQRSGPLNLYHLVILNYELHGDKCMGSGEQLTLKHSTAAMQMATIMTVY